MTFFYLGMVLIALGTGLLKPNISAMVGNLYSEDDPRRDSGFSIFYMGINIGAVLAPLVCGYMAQGESFKRFVASMGFDVTTSWHWGFGAAGVGMCLGLVIFALNRKILEHASRKSRSRSASGDASDDIKTPLTPADWKRIGAYLRLLSLYDPFLGCLRTEGRESESLRQGPCAHGDFRHEVSIEFPAVVHTAFCNHAGADFFSALGQTRKAPAVKSSEVYVGPVIYRTRLRVAGPRRGDDSLREDQPAMVGGSLLPRSDW